MISETNVVQSKTFLGTISCEDYALVSASHCNPNISTWTCQLKHYALATVSNFNVLVLLNYSAHIYARAIKKTAKWKHSYNINVPAVNRTV